MPCLSGIARGEDYGAFSMEVSSPLILLLYYYKACQLSSSVRLKSVWVIIFAAIIHQTLDVTHLSLWHQRLLHCRYSIHNVRLLFFF